MYHCFPRNQCTQLPIIHHRNRYMYSAFCVGRNFCVIFRPIQTHWNAIFRHFYLRLVSNVSGAAQQFTLLLIRVEEKHRKSYGQRNCQSMSSSSFSSSISSYLSCISCTDPPVFCQPFVVV